MIFSTLHRFSVICNYYFTPEFQGIDNGKYEDSQLTIEYVELQSVESNSESKSEQSAMNKAPQLDLFDDDENENSGNCFKDLCQSCLKCTLSYPHNPHYTHLKS